MYPDERVAAFITENFIPVKIHIKERPDDFRKYEARWTPTQLIMEFDRTEQHRIEGFLPVENFLAQLKLGLGKIFFERQEYEKAEKQFRSAYQDHPQSGAAAEAMYWAGVSAHKLTHKSEPLKETYESMSIVYPESEWTHKASVWGK